MRGSFIPFGCSLLVLAVGGCAGQPQFAAIKPIGAAAVEQPSGADELVRAGRSFLADQRYGLAIGQFREALRFDPNSAPANNGLAIAYAAIGRADLARRHFERAIAFAPEQLSYRRNYERFLASVPAQAGDPTALAEVEPAQPQVESDEPQGYHLRMELREASVLAPTVATAAIAVEGPRLSMTESGASLVTGRAQPPAAAVVKTSAPKTGADLERAVAAAFTLERAPSTALVSSASLQRVSLYEVRIVSQRRKDALAQIMMRDFRAQWAAPAMTGAGQGDGPASEAFRLAIGKARQRIAASGQIAMAQRACARARLVTSFRAMGTLRGSDQCSS